MILFFAVALIWIVLLLFKKEDALVFLLFSITINFEAYGKSGFDIDAVLKLMFLLTVLVHVFIHKNKLRKIVPLIILGLVFVANLLFARFDSSYGISSYFTAIVSLFTGFFICFILFAESQRTKLLLTVSLMPLVSVVLGLLLWPVFGVNPFARGDAFGLAGASSSTNLAFFSAIGIGACSRLYYFDRKYKFLVLEIVNFIILLATLTRGGVVAAVIIVVKDFIPFVKETMKTKNRLLSFSILFVAAIPFIAFMINKMIDRTFVAGTLNTSGRIEGWTYILSMSRNTYFGNGYGYLKTRTEHIISAFTAAHNEFLHLFVELGVVGSILFFSILLFIIYSLQKNSKKFDWNLMFFFISFLIYSFFDNTLTNYRYWFPFCVVLSCCYIYPVKTTQKSEDSFNTKVKC